MKKNRIKKVLTGAIGTIVAATITGGTCTGTVFAAESAAGKENSVATESSQNMPGGTPPDAADAGTSGGPGGQAPGGGSSAVTEWTAVNTVTSDTTEKKQKL